MSLKILGGKFRNRSLKSPPSEETRPTLGVVRKAVFDILQDEIEGAHFLDLFAGSGAVGIEALSRGACFVTFVEKSRKSFSCIKANLETLCLTDQAQLISYDVQAALKTLTKKGAVFDLIYIDPPYALYEKKEGIIPLLEWINAHPLLKEGGRLFLEEGSPGTCFKEFSHLKMVNRRTFSQTVLHQFRKI